MFYSLIDISNIFRKDDNSYVRRKDYIFRLSNIAILRKNILPNIILFIESF